jgi:hypothetical protein
MGKRACAQIPACIFNAWATLAAPMQSPRACKSAAIHPQHVKYTLGKTSPRYHSSSMLLRLQVEAYEKKHSLSTSALHTGIMEEKPEQGALYCVSFKKLSR